MDNQELYDAIVEACKNGTVTLDDITIDEENILSEPIRKLSISIPAPEGGWAVSKEEKEVLEALEKIGRGIASSLFSEQKLYNITFDAERRVIEIWGCSVEYSRKSHRWVGLTRHPDREPCISLNTSDWYGSVFCGHNIVDYVFNKNLKVYIGD